MQDPQAIHCKYLASRLACPARSACALTGRLLDTHWTLGMSSTPRALPVHLREAPCAQRTTRRILPAPLMRDARDAQHLWRSARVTRARRATASAGLVPFGGDSESEGLSLGFEAQEGAGSASTALYRVVPDRGECTLRLELHLPAREAPLRFTAHPRRLLGAHSQAPHCGTEPRCRTGRCVEQPCRRSRCIVWRRICPPFATGTVSCRSDDDMFYCFIYAYIIDLGLFDYF